MTEKSGTRQRAELRGRESVARWRLQTGAWGARAYALLLALPAFAAILWAGPARGATLITSVLFAALALGASFAVGRGRRWAAVALLGFFALNYIAAIVISGRGVLAQGLFINGAVLFCLVQGVWGAFSLAAVERDRPGVPQRIAEPAA